MSTLGDFNGEQQEAYMRGTIAMLPEDIQLKLQDLEQKMLALVGNEGEVGIMVTTLVTTLLVNKLK